MKIPAAFLTLFLLLSAGRAMAEEIVFEMSVFGIRFGTMTVTRIMENDSTELYTLHAKGKTDFLFMQREEESKYKVQYRNGSLHASDYTYINKGITEKWSRIRRVNGHYRIETMGGEQRLLKEPVDYSLLKLYFEPEKKRTRVFCEEDCAFSDLKRDSTSDSLVVTCKDGSRTTYFLKDGRIDRLDIHLAVATVKLTRIN